MNRDITHLVGREFIWGTQDCWGLVRDFYRDVFDIELPDFARPEDFWQKGLDLFNDGYRSAGFSAITVHPQEWVMGDVFVCAIDSPFGNHSAVLLDNGRILHHLYGGMSRTDPYRGLIRNTTVGVFRHHAVADKLPSLQDTASFRDFLSPKMQERYDGLARSAVETA